MQPLKKSLTIVRDPGEFSGFQEEGCGVVCVCLVSRVCVCVCLCVCVCVRAYVHACM